MTQNPDYRNLLKHELLHRQKQNGRYSSRAFARDLGVTPSHLSQLFQYKKHMSEAKLASVLHEFTWSNERKQYFWTLFKLQNSRTQVLKAKYEKELSCLAPQAEKRNLRVDEFKLIADWYHYAIVELVKREDFVNDPEWMANQLGIKPELVRAALKRLSKLKILQSTRNGLTVTDWLYAGGKTSSTAIRQQHEQYLLLAQKAIWDQEFAERHFSGVTMAIDPDRLPEAQEMIRDFRRKLMHFLERGRRRQVYRLGVNLFRLDKRIK